MRLLLIGLVISLLLATTACAPYKDTGEGKRLEFASLENKGLFEYALVLVGEHDGCKIYKFWSSEGTTSVNWHFFVRCSNETVTTTTNSSYTTTNGKQTTTHHFIGEVTCTDNTQGGSK